MMGVGGTLIAQANQDIANGKIHNFFTPYDNLGMDNPGFRKGSTLLQ